MIDCYEILLKCSLESRIMGAKYDIYMLTFSAPKWVSYTSKLHLREIARMLLNYGFRLIETRQFLSRDVSVPQTSF